MLSLIGRAVLAGERPPRPLTKGGEIMSDAMWDLTNACWAQLPSERPTAQGVTDDLAKILSDEELIQSLKLDGEETKTPSDSTASRTSGGDLPRVDSAIEKAIEATLRATPSHASDVDEIGCRCRIA